MNTPFDLTGKHILVTGASSGIGRAIAIECSKMGATVYITGRNMERLKETDSQLSGNDNQIKVCDLCNPLEMSTMVESLPRLDGVVHVAGILTMIPCKLLTEEIVDNVLDINLKAPMLLQAALLSKKKINKGASIIFIASITSSTPYIGNSVYSASKGALISYANCLSLELAPLKIRVNCISPAMVWTELISKDNIDNEVLKNDEAKYPLKRYGKPEDIAYLSIYLLSDASTWMTGSNVRITGGVF
jgi:NAD(P)-dependent dehydrogenase (short-subunit alcohol dehydrogenase family)